jgi:diguanylate cyclase (GGDEF)-like protein
MKPQPEIFKQFGKLLLFLVYCLYHRSDSKGEAGMKRHILLISNLIIILAVVAGFTTSIYKDTKSYQQLAEKHLENIVSLADVDISNRIQNAMSKPVMVSKTMANDEFLKTWLAKEPQNVGNDAYMKQLYGYLKAYQLKYGYTTVFCVSAQTGNYYYQDGLNKTVSKHDSHDVWFYNFVSSGHEYDLEVDTNQANKNNVAVFVNFRVTDENGKLLGVIGVGQQVSFFEEAIRNYEKNYGMSIYIVNVGGAKNSFTGSTDLFVDQNRLSEYTGIKDKIQLNRTGTSRIQWFTSGSERKCLITKYDATLGWYLVLKMETNSISNSFQKRIMSNVLFMIFSLFACILVTTIVFFNYNRRIVEIENIDDLTGLPNRKLFLKQYKTFLKKHAKEEKVFFMLDIDRFKNINDTHGHLFGNAVLEMVADELRKAVNDCGMTARWGGDEFIGIMSVGTEEANRILSRFMDALKNKEKNGDCTVTVSIGLIPADARLNLEQTIKKADEILYRSKENGRDRITIC